MSRNIKFIAIVTIIISLAVILYGGYSIAVTRQVQKAFSFDTNNVTRFSRVKPYMDGIVIDDMSLGPYIRLSTLYIEGYPWQILRNKLQHIYIKQADIKARNILDQRIVWPFQHNVPLTVENVNLTFPFMAQDITFEGEFKQAPNIPLLFKFNSTSPILTLQGQSEVRIKDSIVQSIDIEFQDAHVDTPILQAKRSSGWLSLTYDENLWNIVSEIDAGFIKIPDYSLFDTTFKLNGTAAQLDFFISGNDQQSKNAWIFERQANDLHIRNLDQTKTIAWAGFNNTLLRKASTIMTTFAKDESKVEIVSKPKEKPVIKTAKIEKKKQPEKKAPKKPEAVIPVQEPETSEVVIIEKPPQTVYVPFRQLIQNSLFEGFLYDRPMVLMPRVCVSEAQNECWIARSQGGVLRYNANDPWAVPPYFARLQDYEQATKLRALLVLLNIDTLILSGDKNGVQDMSVLGRNAQGTKIHIDLSVLGLSN